MHYLIRTISLWFARRFMWSLNDGGFELLWVGHGWIEFFDSWEYMRDDPAWVTCWGLHTNHNYYSLYRHYFTQQRPLN